ncbi:hypothetical protein SD80_012320 [Scytonema tolypothrichoides VB-61278]|nr:hypothetical protein SD80_012320 [Scytonema tolypothrichoides VB-61278]
MPKERIYTTKDIIDTYIETQRKHIHDDFTNYYTNLLVALQKAFNITLYSRPQNPPPAEKSGISKLFASTIDSLIAIRTPWSNFLETSVIVMQLEKAGEVGTQVDRISGLIDDMSEQNKKLHEEMLKVLFDYLYRPSKTTVTSQDLYAQGFDDATEPDKNDYWDYY